MRKHDESKDLKSVSRIGRVISYNNTIELSKGATIGIKMWGKLDFLTKYRHWRIIWNNTVKGNASTLENVERNSVRAAKKAAKTPRLTDKTKKHK